MSAWMTQPSSKDYRRPVLSPEVSKLVEGFGAMAGPSLMRLRAEFETRVFCYDSATEKAKYLNKLAAIDEVLHLRSKNLRKRAGGVSRDDFAALVRRVEDLEAIIAAGCQS